MTKEECKSYVQRAKPHLGKQWSEGGKVKSKKFTNYFFVEICELNSYPGENGSPVTHSISGLLKHNNGRATTKSLKIIVEHFETAKS